MKMTLDTRHIFVTPSVIIEYLFCPRFIYYEHCLGIPQHEEKRFKVLKGREVHEGKERTNVDHLRKRLGCVRKETAVWLASTRYHIKGEIDEVLFLADGTCAPLDYKFAEYKEGLFRTHKYQSALYGLLIKDNYDREVKKGFICYVRSRHMVKEILFTEALFNEAITIVKEVLKIIQTGYYPRGTKYSASCIDCCYRNICV